MGGCADGVRTVQLCGVVCWLDWFDGFRCGSSLGDGGLSHDWRHGNSATRYCRLGDSVDCAALWCERQLGQQSHRHCGRLVLAVCATESESVMDTQVADESGCVTACVVAGGRTTERGERTA